LTARRAAWENLPDRRPHPHDEQTWTLQLDGGSTIAGADSGYGAAEPNRTRTRFHDCGHGHFHDALIWGDRLTAIGFVTITTSWTPPNYDAACPCGETQAHS
jgi:hypothetical protein